MLENIIQQGPAYKTLLKDVQHRYMKWIMGWAVLKREVPFICSCILSIRHFISSLVARVQSLSGSHTHTTNRGCFPEERSFICTDDERFLSYFSCVSSGRSLKFAKMKLMCRFSSFPWSQGTCVSYSCTPWKAEKGSDIGHTRWTKMRRIKLTRIVRNGNLCLQLEIGTGFLSHSWSPFGEVPTSM